MNFNNALIRWMANRTIDSYETERFISYLINELFYAIEFYYDSTTHLYEKYTSTVLLIKEDNRLEGIKNFTFNAFPVTKNFLLFV